MSALDPNTIEEWRFVRIDKSLFELIPQEIATICGVLPWRHTDSGVQLVFHSELDDDAILTLLLELGQMPDCALSEDQIDLTILRSDQPLSAWREVIDFHYRRASANVSCTPQLAYPCPMQWSNMQRTDDPEVRFCGSCHTSVFLVANELEYQNRAEAGECVALIPSPAPPDELFVPLAGMPMDPGYPPIQDRPLSGKPAPALEPFDVIDRASRLFRKVFGKGD